MKALDCVCGHHLEASDDEQLFSEARAHVAQAHPNMQLTDEQVRQIVTDGAYDK